MAELGARQVGEFFNQNARKQNRTVKNPLDKCTIVSILPKDIEERNFTIGPGLFRIPAGTYENPSTLVVGVSVWWKDVGIEQPLQEIPASSVQVADSVVKDYCSGMLGVSSDAQPGLFFVLGEMNAFKIKTEYKAKLEEVKKRQDNWYMALIKVADSLWARSNGNPLVISDEMRLAARSMNLNEKPWIRDFHLIERKPCRACGSLMDPNYPVCAICKSIDPSHPLAKDLKFAV